MPSPRETANGFHGQYRFLSNFYPAPIMDKTGIVYPTAEHAYQAQKTLIDSVRIQISALPTPGDAKRYWKAHKDEIRKDWDDVKIQSMALVLWHKFNQHPELADRLIHTGDMALIEYNNWHDLYWGVCTCAIHRKMGKNTLGTLLAHIRSMLIKRQSNES